MVAEKLDPTVGRIYFLSYLSNSDESGENDHLNEFRGSKNGGKELWGGLKWPKNGRKSQKSGDKMVQPPSGSQARSRRVRRRLAVKFYGRHRPVVAHLMVWCVYSDSGRNRLLWLKLERPANGSK